MRFDAPTRNTVLGVLASFALGACGTLAATEPPIQAPPVPAAQAMTGHPPSDGLSPIAIAIEDTPHHPWEGGVEQQIWTLMEARWQAPARPRVELSPGLEPADEAELRLGQPRLEPPIMCPRDMALWSGAHDEMPEQVPELRLALADPAPDCWR
jgi:hypothetical protein